MTRVWLPHTHIHMHARTHTHTYTCMHAHTHTHIHMHARTHTQRYLKSKSLANWFLSLWNAGSCAAAWALFVRESWLMAVPLLELFPLPSTLIPNDPISRWTYCNISGVILVPPTTWRNRKYETLESYKIHALIITCMCFKANQLPSVLFL